MATAQPQFAFGEQNQFVELVTRGVTGPPKNVFPHMPNRTQWNEDWPYLHTITEAVRYIVDEESRIENPVSALMCQHRLMEMGFGDHDAHHTISAILGASKNGFVKVARRHIPEGGGKSWAMYAACHESAFHINQKDIRLAAWLATAGNAERLESIQENIRRGGFGVFISHPDAQHVLAK